MTQIPLGKTTWELCPICKSSNIEGDSVEIDYLTAWQNVECKDCGAAWQEVYNAAFRDNLEEGDIPMKENLYVVLYQGEFTNKGNLSVLVKKAADSITAVRAALDFPHVDTVIGVAMAHEGGISFNPVSLVVPTPVADQLVVGRPSEPLNLRSVL